MLLTQELGALEKIHLVVKGLFVVQDDAGPLGSLYSQWRGEGTFKLGMMLAALRSHLSAGGTALSVHY